MTFGERLRGLFAAPVEKGMTAGSVVALPFWPGFPTAHPDRPAASAESLAAVIRAVALYADALASLPIAAVRRDPDGGAATSVPVPALSAWSYAHKELIGADALLTGNGYALIDPQTSALSTHPASHVTPETDRRTGLVWYRVRALDEMTPERIVRANFVVHLRYRVWKDPRFGVSPLTMGKPSADAALESTETMRALFANLSQAGVLLTAPGRISKETAEALKATWEEKFGGGNKGRTAVLGDGLTAERLETFNANDSQLVELCRYSVAEIARIFGTPMVLLGETTTTNFATAIETSRQFTLNALKPFLIRVADELSAKVLTPKQHAAGVRVEFDASGLTLSPGRETSEYLGALVSQGIMAPNEARNLLGLPDVPEGNLLRTPAGASPAAPKEPEPSEPSEPAP